MEKPLILAAAALLAAGSMAGCSTEQPAVVDSADAPVMAEPIERPNDSARDEPASLVPPPAAVDVDLVASAAQPTDAPEIELVHVANLAWEASLSNPCFAPDGETLYVADSALGVALFDTNTWQRTKVWKWDGEEELERIALSADGTILAAADEDGKIGVWDTSSGELLTRYTHPPDPETEAINFPGVECLAISPDGQRIVSSVSDFFDYIVWESRTGKQLWRSKTRWRDHKPAAFDRRGGSLALWTDQTLVVLDPVSGQQRRSIPFASDSLDTVLFAPHGAALLVQLDEEIGDSRRNFIGLVSVQMGELLWCADSTIAWPDGLAFTPDGKSIVLTGERFGKPGRVVHFHDASDGTLKATFKTTIFNDGAPGVSPDGMHLVVGSNVWRMPDR